MGFDCGGNGDVASMALKAKQLYETGGNENCQRAMFWLRRADAIAASQSEKDNVQSWRKQISSDSGACTQSSKAPAPTLPQ